MRDFDRQAKVVRPFIYLVFSWIVFFLLLALLLIPKLMPENSISAQIMSFEALAKYIRIVIDSTAILACLCVVMVSVLFLLPLSLCVRAVRKRYHKSNFPEGLDTKKLKDSDYFIYTQMREFFIKSGFKIMKGFDSDEVVTRDNTHFASIKLIRSYTQNPFWLIWWLLFGWWIAIFFSSQKTEVIYILINHSFYGMVANRPDRRGFIPIYHPQDIPKAKQKIKQVFNAYFNKKDN